MMDLKHSFIWSWLKQDIAVTTLTRDAEAAPLKFAQQPATLPQSMCWLCEGSLWSLTCCLALMPLRHSALFASCSREPWSLKKHGPSVQQFASVKPILEWNSMISREFGVATWKWSAGHAPEKLQNRISEYLLSSKLREEYKWELQI